MRVKVLGKTLLVGDIPEGITLYLITLFFGYAITVWSYSQTHYEATYLARLECMEFYNTVLILACAMYLLHDAQAIEAMNDYLNQKPAQ